MPVELHFNQKVDDELEDQSAYSIEQKIEKLVNVREKVFSSAAKNIERAQKRYSEDFNKKRNNVEVE